MKEIWKDIQNYEDYYQVSNFGNVRSKDRKVVAINNPNRIYNVKGKNLKPVIIKDTGYYRVSLHKNGKQFTHKIHRLVAKQFIPNPKDLPEINHLDFDKANNHVDNLEWITKYDNILHERAYRMNKKECNNDFI